MMQIKFFFWFFTEHQLECISIRLHEPSSTITLKENVLPSLNWTPKNYHTAQNTNNITKITITWSNWTSENNIEFMLTFEFTMLSFFLYTHTLIRVQSFFRHLYSWPNQRLYITQHEMQMKNPMDWNVTGAHTLFGMWLTKE